MMIILYDIRMDILFEVISLLVIIIAVVILAYRILQNSGLKLTRFSSIGRNTSIKYKPDNRECINIFICAILFRIFIVVAGFVIYCIFKDDGKTFSFEQIYDNWVQWDANCYIRISHGYDYYLENNEYVTLVFYPLYPLLLKICNVFISNINISGIVVSTLCYAGGCVYMYKLICIDYSKVVAQRAIVLLSIFPFGFFYGGIMSESTFFITSVMTLYYSRKHNYPAAGLCGMLTALSRSVGVFLIIPLTVEFMEEYKILENPKEIKKIINLVVSKWLWLLLIPLGMLVYLFINYRVAGNPFEFLCLEEKYWHQTGQPFFKTVGSLWDIIKGNYSVSTKMGAFVPGTIILFVMYGVMFSGLRKHRTMYMVWFMIYLVVNTTMSWPLSLCRYLALNIPFYMVTAEYCEKNDRLYTAFVVGGSVMFGIYMTGYLMGKQIM